MNVDPAEFGLSGRGPEIGPSLLAGRTEWLRGEGESVDVVLSSRVRLARNLAGFPFVPRASRTDRAQIIDLCRRRLLAAQIVPKTMWVDLHEASRLDRMLLMERHLISRQHVRGKLSNGSGGSGEPRGVMVSLPDERLSVMVNEEDHLRIQVIHAGLDLGGAFALADRVDDAIEASLDYAFSPRFGYLTACPTNVGTGVRLSVMMHLPALRMIGELEKVRNAANDMGLAIRGFHGEGSDAVGDLYQISNQTTLGRSESVLLQDIGRDIVPKVVEYERHARQSLLSQRRLSTEDTVHRALGLLRSARQLSMEESMKMLSHVRLGIRLGLITDVDETQVHNLMLLVQPAHVQRVSGSEMSQRDRRAARADLARSTLGP